MAVWSALAMLPDLDVVGFALGVHYGDPWGHRGAAHSLLIAAALGVALSAIARRRSLPLGRTALFTVIVLASHGLLDTMTDGGLGCALLWPFSLTRYFAPWRPIPVAPIGLDFLSPYGAIVSAIELALFGPLFLYALRPRRLTMRPLTAASLTALWLVSVWLIASGDPIRDSILGFALRENTSYAGGFSDAAFRSVTPGMSEQDLRRLLGAPYREDWYYPPRDQPALRAEDAFAGGGMARVCWPALRVRLRRQHHRRRQLREPGALDRHVDRRCPASPRTSAGSVLGVHLESHRSLSPPAVGLLPGFASGSRASPVGEGRLTNRPALVWRFKIGI